MLRAWFVIAGLCVTAPASAQTADDEAREAFEQGRVAASEGRLAEARDHFERSFEADPRVPTAFNLATVYLELDRPRRCVTLIEAALAGELGALPGDRTGSFQELGRRCAAVLAHLTIRAREGAEVLVDGELRGTISSSGRLVVVLDPGRHTVRVQADVEEAVTRQIVLARAERASLEIVLASRVDNTLAEPTPEESDDSAVYWVIGLSIGALVVAGGVLALFFATRSEDRVTDPIWGDVEAFGIDF